MFDKNSILCNESITFSTLACSDEVSVEVLSRIWPNIGMPIWINCIFYWKKMMLQMTQNQLLKIKLGFLHKNQKTQTKGQKAAVDGHYLR